MSEENGAVVGQILGSLDPFEVLGIPVDADFRGIQLAKGRRIVELTRLKNTVDNVHFALIRVREAFNLLANASSAEFFRIFQRSCTEGAKTSHPTSHLDLPQDSKVIATLQEETKKLKAEIKKEKAKTSTLTKTLASKDKSVTQLVSDISSTKKSLEEAERLCGEKNITIKDLKQKLAAIDKHVTQQRSDISATTKSLEEAERLCNERNVKIENLKQNLDEAERLRDEKNIIIETLNSKLESTKAELLELRSKPAGHRKIVKNLQAQLSAMEKDCAVSQLKLSKESGLARLLESKLSAIRSIANDSSSKQTRLVSAGNRAQANTRVPRAGTKRVTGKIAAKKAEHGSLKKMTKYQKYNARKRSRSPEAFKCPEMGCDRSFSHAHNVGRHIRNFHTKTPLSATQEPEADNIHSDLVH